jgi:hypothetical protein
MNSKKLIAVKPKKKRSTLANLELSSFLSKIRSYLLSTMGIELYKQLKMILPSYFFSKSNNKQTLLKKNFLWIFFIFLILGANEKEVMDTQKILLKKAQQTILKDMDIFHLLSKIKEIDKMKDILFSEEQKVIVYWLIWFFTHF